MRTGTFERYLCGAVVFAAVCGVARAQAAKAQATASVVDDKAAEQDQDELFRLLRVSPTLTTVLEHDPSLLADQAYVSRTNPELAQFLVAHPEVTRNPDFYLFSGLSKGAHRGQSFERKVWPEYQQPVDEANNNAMRGPLLPFLVFLCILGSLLWLIQVFLANRRWGRIFKLQMEAHGKLIDRFGSSQELIQYMESEAGKRFLEAAPIPVHSEGGQQIPSLIGRVLTPLQIGSVLSLLGTGFLLVRHNFDRGMQQALLLLGFAILMPGLGFLVSAGITWAMADHFGLLPSARPEGESHDDSVAGQ